MAFGQVTPISQSRTLAASAYAAVPGDSASDSDNAFANDFGAFNGSIDPLATAIAGTDISIAQAFAPQNSSLSSSPLTASGEVSVGMTLLPGDGTSAAAAASSEFEFQFNLANLSSISLIGKVDTESISTGGAAVPTMWNSVELFDIGTSTVLFSNLTFDESFSLASLLPPGDYRLSASANIDASQVGSLTAARTVAGMSSFELTFDVQSLAVPEGGGWAGLVGVGYLGILAWRRRGE